MVSMARRRKKLKPDPQRVRGLNFAVSQADGVVRIVPRAHAGPGLRFRSVAAILVGVAAVVVGGWAWWVGFALRPGDPDMVPPWWFVWLCPGGLFLLFAGVPLAAAAKLLWFRNLPLVIDPTGRVQYGSQEIVPAGSATAVRLDRTTEGETDYEVEICRLCVVGSGGQSYPLPEPYFSRFDGWKVGEELARSLAAALRVYVSTGPNSVPIPDVRATGLPGSPRSRKKR